MPETILEDVERRRDTAKTHRNSMDELSLKGEKLLNLSVEETDEKSPRERTSQQLRKKKGKVNSSSTSPSLSPRILQSGSNVMLRPTTSPSLLSGIEKREKDKEKETDKEEEEEDEVGGCGVGGTVSRNAKAFKPSLKLPIKAYLPSKNLAGSAASVAADRSRHKLEGYVYFNKKTASDYEKYWMVLDPVCRKIKCFNSFEQKKEVFSLDLTGIRRVEAEAINLFPGFVIQTLKHGKLKTWKFYPENEKMNQTWMDAINDANDDGLFSCAFCRRLLCALRIAFKSQQQNADIDDIDFLRSVIHVLRRPGMLTVRLEEYAPSVFSAVRGFFGVNSASLLASSWMRQQQKQSEENEKATNFNLLKDFQSQFEKNKFINSDDNMFFIKIIDESEKESVLSGIYEYYQQLTKRVDNSSIPLRIIGLFSYCCEFGEVFMVLVHNNMHGNEYDLVVEDLSKKFSLFKEFWNIQTQQESTSGSSSYNNDDCTTSSTPATVTSSSTGAAGRTRDPHQKIFGASLHELTPSAPSKIPPFVHSAMKCLIQDSITYPHFNPHIIFPLDPNDVSWLESNKSVIEKRLLNVSDIRDPRVVAGLLMAYLSELPVPLVPKKTLRDVFEAMEIDDLPLRDCSLNSLLAQLESTSYLTLKYMVNSLSQLGAIRNSLGHLCDCFGPVLFATTSRKVHSSHSQPKRRSMEGRTSLMKKTPPRNTNSTSNDQTDNPSKLLLYCITNRKELFRRKKRIIGFEDFSSTTGKRLLSRASFSDLIKKLTDPYYDDPDFGCLLMIYHSYLRTTPEELVHQVLKIFTLYEEIKPWILKRRKRSLKIIFDWLQSHGAPSFWSNKLLLNLETFFTNKNIHFQDLEKNKIRSITVLITNLLNFQDPKEPPKGRTLSPERYKEIEKSILTGTITTKQCAHELTLLDYSKFKLINTEQLLNCSFLDRGKAPHFNHLADHTNWVDLWTQSMIVSQLELSKRALALAKFIELAVELLSCGNFSSSFAIYAALNSHSISRLDGTWDEIPKRVLRQYQFLKFTFETTRNYEHYREALLNYRAVVPFLGILSKDLAAIEESNLTVLSPPDIYNITKARLLFKQIDTIYNLQQQIYFPSKDDLYFFFNNLTYLNSDQIYSMSLLCEPLTTDL